MSYNFAEIPEYRNDWDDLYDAILEARENKKCVIVPVPADKAPSSYRQNIRVAMKNRNISVETCIPTSDCIYVWFKAYIVETGDKDVQP